MPIKDSKSAESQIIEKTAIETLQLIGCDYRQEEDLVKALCIMFVLGKAAGAISKLNNG